MPKRSAAVRAGCGWTQGSKRSPASRELLHVRGHVWVGGAVAILDVVITLGQASLFFTINTAGSEGTSG